MPSGYYIKRAQNRRAMKMVAKDLQTAAEPAVVAESVVPEVVAEAKPVDPSALLQVPDAGDTIDSKLIVCFA